MKIIKTNFKGLLIVKQKNNFDKRGSLRETFNDKILKVNNFNFEYCTISKAKSLRGFHFQYKYQQAKYVNVLKGKILDYVIDLRRNSKTFGKSFKIILSDKNYLSLFIPKGFAHGYLTISDIAIINYQVDNYYNPEAEEGIPYDDDLLKIDWGVEKSKIIISKKDQNFKPFKW